MLLYFVTNYPFRVRNKEGSIHGAYLASHSQRFLLLRKDTGTFIYHLPFSRLVSCKPSVSQAHLDGRTPGEASALLELELGVSHLMGVLSTELRPCGRAVHTLNHGAVSPAPLLLIVAKLKSS